MPYLLVLWSVGRAVRDGAALLRRAHLHQGVVARQGGAAAWLVHRRALGYGPGEGQGSSGLKNDKVST